jgi:hypothetical protein
MLIEIGKTYINRQGHKIVLMKEYVQGQYPFEDIHHVRYDRQGREQSSRMLDLVSEVVDKK